MTPEQIRIARLYIQMPGAPRPPEDAAFGYLWGEIEGNEHWMFCRAIVQMINDAETGHVYSLHRVEKDKP